MISKAELIARGMIQTSDPVPKSEKECASPVKSREVISKETENVIDYCANTYRHSKTAECCNVGWGGNRFLRIEYAISESLEGGDYIPALQDIWTSGSLNGKIKKIKSLMKKHGDLHSPFMYELSLLLYQNASKENKTLTLQRICWPLIGAANFRTIQDAQCSIKPVHCKPYAEKIQQVYINQMCNRIKKDLGESEISPEIKYQQSSKEVEEAIRKVSVKTLSADKLPNPIWVAGLNSSSFNTEMQLKNVRSKKDHKQLRQDYATLAIGKNSLQGEKAT